MKVTENRDWKRKWKFEEDRMCNDLVISKHLSPHHSDLIWIQNLHLHPLILYYLQTFLLLLYWIIIYPSLFDFSPSTKLLTSWMWSMVFHSLAKDYVLTLLLNKNKFTKFSLNLSNIFSLNFKTLVSESEFLAPLIRGNITNKSQVWASV